MVPLEQTYSGVGYPLLESFRPWRAEGGGSTGGGEVRRKEEKAKRGNVWVAGGGSSFVIDFKCCATIDTGIVCGLAYKVMATTTLSVCAT